MVTEQIQKTIWRYEKAAYFGGLEVGNEHTHTHKGYFEQFTLQYPQHPWAQELLALMGSRKPDRCPVSSGALSAK